MTDMVSEVSRPAIPPEAGSHSGGSIWALTLGSVGVVYGDIGTSPLYAFRVAVLAAAESGR
jgi:K+ transporter